MSEWKRLICVHGIQEGLDSHSCHECKDIAEKCGYDISHCQTYIFTSQSQIDHELKSHDRRSK